MDSNDEPPAVAGGDSTHREGRSDGPTDSAYATAGPDAYELANAASTGVRGSAARRAVTDGGEDRERLRVLVSGGSMAGLFAGHALAELDHDVRVFERSTGRLRHRGAGIVAQPRMLSFLDDRGMADPDRITTTTNRRLYLASDGSVRRAYRSEMNFAAWDAIYRRLREAFPDDRYHAGREVVDTVRRDGRVEARLDGDADPVAGDLFLAAEGVGSATRERLTGTEPEYAGYVAWRGVADEGELPDGVVDRFDDAFPFYEGDGRLALGYLIPGPDGETEPGQRRLNWVWYDTVPDDDLARVLTDDRGCERERSVPPGRLRESAEEELTRTAADLPPSFERLVRETDNPFVQPIVDLAVDRTVFGRICLLGDAAFAARPHTAMGTEKAAGDAIELADALAERGDLDAALSAWESRRRPFGERLVAKGKRMGGDRLS